jgi:hypothetical protein
MFFRFPSAARRGLSLTEVLIAMFVMAIGMISLLVLFPVGIINTKWALQDNRVAVAAYNANSLGESPRINTLTGTAYSLRTDPVYRTALQAPGARIAPGPANQPFWNNATGQWKFGTTGPGAPVQGPYPPVYVDPLGATLWSPTFVIPAVVPAGTRLGFSIGFDALAPQRVFPPYPGAIQGTMRQTPPIPVTIPVTNPPFTVTVGKTSLGLPRVYSSQMNNLPLAAQIEARRLCVVTDDAVFEELGRTRRFNPAANQAVEPNIPFVQREYRYSWAYMCRWPRAAEPSVVEMSVVLYGGRPLSSQSNNNPNGVRFPPNEKVYLGHPAPVNGILRQGRTFIQGSNEVVIQVPNGQPSGIRRGDWVLDNTLIMPTGAVNPATGLTEYAPFSERIVRLPRPGYAPAFIDTGIANGHFYNVVSVSNPFIPPGGPAVMVQVIELDRPAKADGYELVHMGGVVDVIEKSSGKMPQR